MDAATAAAAAREHLFDKTAHECKGVLLNFEDAAGKVWSRSVKEKGLHAGVAVGFYRSAGTRPWRLELQWRRPHACPQRRRQARTACGGVRGYGR
jgi:hypothetical protein